MQGKHPWQGEVASRGYATENKKAYPVSTQDRPRP